MRVIALDPFVTAAKAAELGFDTAANLDELLPKVDFLTLHVPLGDDTKSLSGSRELAGSVATVATVLLLIGTKDLALLGGVPAPYLTAPLLGVVVIGLAIQWRRLK